MRKQTIEKYLKLYKEAKESGMGLRYWCTLNKVRYRSIREALKCAGQEEAPAPVENDETGCERDKDGRITGYRYRISRKDRFLLAGRLTREDMELIYRTYSCYGDDLTQQSVSRNFPHLSLGDFKAILKAFNITKDSSPFPPHMLEEMTEEELGKIQYREKENSILRKTEENRVRNMESLLRKYVKENMELKGQLSNMSRFKVTIPKITPMLIRKTGQAPDKTVNLYVSDMHLGSYTTFGSLYDENRKYGFDEARRRLSVILKRLSTFGKMGALNLIMMGDNVDCCGVPGKTSRLDHDMPQNLDPKEQGNKYIELILWFLGSIIGNELSEEISVYSVPEGNHGGNFEYMCNKALLSTVNSMYPDVGTTMWDKYYGRLDIDTHVFILFHGKDGMYMQKPMPVNLDDRTRVLLYEWLDNNGIYKDGVHFIKGDLHSNTLNSCRRFDYRNVLSLYGASDYSNYRYSRNAYGMSWDMVSGGELYRGTFENP